MWILAARNKLFTKTENRRTLKLFVSHGTPVEVPDWVRESNTFKSGVADSSIRDLTPGAIQPDIVPREAQRGSMRNKVKLIDNSKPKRATPPKALVGGEVKVTSTATGPLLPDNGADPLDTKPAPVQPGPPLPAKATVDKPAKPAPAGSGVDNKQK